MYLDLIKNASLLIALANIYSLLARRRIFGKRGTKILIGLLFGAGTVIGMLIPFKYAPGIFYDGRSIILTIAGLFGGGTTGAVSILIAGAYRAYLGGNGVWAGLSTIISCTLVGLAFRRASHNHPEKYSLPMLIVIGAAAHIAMLASQLLVKPWPIGFSLIQKIWLPIMLIFPAATMLIAILLKNEEQRIQTERELEISEAHYHDLVESSQALIWQCDTEGRYTYLNPAWETAFGYQIQDMLGKKITDFQATQHADRDLAAFSSVLQNIPLKDYETIQLGKNGEEIHMVFNATPLLNAEGFPYGISGTAYDITARKQAQNDLQISEQKFKNQANFLDRVIDNSPFAMHVMDTNGVLIRANQTLRNTLNVTDNMIVGKYNIHHDENLITQGLMPDVETVFNDLKIARFTMYWTGKKAGVADLFDANRIWIDVSIFPITDETGKLMNVVCQYVDITQRKRAEKKLEASIKREKELADIVREAPVAIAFGYPDGRLENCNDAFSQLTGYSIAELQQIDWNEMLTSPKWQTIEKEKLSELSASQNIVQYEKEYLRKDGTPVPVELTVSAKFDPSGAVIHYIGFVSDITERKQAKITLQNLASHQEALLAAIPEIIMETDNNKVYTWANQPGLEFFGENVLGKEAAEYFEGEQNTYEIVQPLFNGNQNLIYLESWQRRKDGQKRLLGWWCHVLKDEDGQVIGSLSSARDITEQYEDKELLHQLNVNLESRVKERTAELEAFAYSVSHDLKAPLRGIDGYSHLLLDDYADKLDEEGRFFLHTIRQATQQMKQLIEDLLEYSRMQRRTISIKTVDVTQLVEELLAERAAETAAQNITVAVEIPPMHVVAEAEGLAQVLRNLLDNAIKFSRGVPVPRIEIGGREEKKSCILWVRDNGIGFDPKYQDRIFEIFQRLHSAEEYPGTGIGLAIVRQGMKRMNGRVWAESSPGEGAVFTIEIPKEQKNHRDLQNKWSDL